MSYGRYEYQAGSIGGFLGKAVKGIAKVAAPVVGGMFGGPFGAAAGGLVSKALGGRAAAVVTAGSAIASLLPTQQSTSAPIDRAGFNLGPININPAAILPGGAPFLSFGKGPVPMENGTCPVGYHPNKQAGKYGAARTYCVRNRSMNPANGRAIGRAATRIKKGAKQYARVLRVLGKKSGRMVPRGRKRS